MRLNKNKRLRVICIGLVMLGLCPGCQSAWTRRPPAMRSFSLKFPRAAESFSVPMAGVPGQATQRFSLGWNYPLALPAAGTVFDVEFTPDLNSGWLVLGTVAASPFVHTITSPPGGYSARGFYRVATRSENSSTAP